MGGGWNENTKHYDAWRYVDVVTRFCEKLYRNKQNSARLQHENKYVENIYCGMQENTNRVNKYWT